MSEDGFERGMEESEKAARYKWTDLENEMVMQAIAYCARTRPEFTADRVWAVLGEDFPVTKGMAARLNKSVGLGLIVGTDDFRRSTRKGEHGRGQRLGVWRSLIYKP